MAATGQEMAYRCEQCGSSEIVALSQLYEQGTRSFSGRFTSGVSQSYSRESRSPPSAEAIIYAHCSCGDSNCSFLSPCGRIAGFSAILQHPKSIGPLKSFSQWSFLFYSACMLFLRLLFNLSQIARYNREVYPHLHSDWAHTFMCRRCGKYSLIRP